MKNEYLEGRIRHAANRIGIDIKRHRPEATESGRLAAMLKYNDINLVLDVGANVGHFARSLRGSGYGGQLVSFEPLSSAHATLLLASKNDPRWDIAPRVAIGDREDEVEINISGNSVSSSVLEMLDTHVDAAAGSAYVGQERVRLSKLDTVASEYLGSAKVPFLKIDTQGYETQVLDGATQLLSSVRGLQMELSFVPLYKGQQLFDVLSERMRAQGFSIWAIWPGLCDPNSGRMLQVDAIFFRDTA